MKKALLITGGVILFLFVALLTLPLLFKDEIKDLVVEQVNKSLNAKVDIGDVDLSFIRNFPSASVLVKDVCVVGKDSFARDTLLSLEEASVVVNIKSFINSENGYQVNKVVLTRPNIYAHVLKSGRANWDIMIPDTAQVKEPEDTTKTEFKLSLEKLAIEHANVIYNDEKSKMYLKVQDLNHQLSGDMTADETVLSTATSIEQISFLMDGIPYLNKAKFLLEADVDADIKNNKYTISKNKVQLNAIELALEGWVKLLENEDVDMDLKVKAPDTQFKDILSLIPAIYAKDFSDIQTKGKVKFDAFAKGIYNEKRMPAFGVNFLVSDAWFKYPALPKSIDNINIDTKITNPGGSLDATVVDVKKFAFALGGNPFSGSIHLKTPISDPDVNMYAKGILNLGMIKDVYPMEEGMSLSGILDIDLKLAGKMSYYEKQMYDKFFFDGKLNITNMVAKTTALPQPVEIQRVNLLFNPKTVALPALQMKVGKSDISGNGQLENFIPYIFKNETLKGNLNVSSNYLNANDFMTPTTEAPAGQQAKPAEQAPAASTSSSAVLIPSNLDFTLNSSFKKVIYDKMDISNLKGTLQVVQSKLFFKGIAMDAMGGSLLLNGLYNTQNPQKTSFQVDQLKITDVLFTEIFKQVDAVKKLAPMFEKTSGRFSTSLNMYTDLDKEMSPVLNTLTAKGVLQSKDLTIKDVKVLQTIATVTKRNELANPTIKNVSVPFEIEKGRVYTDPFDIAVADTKVTVQRGSTGIDQTIDYTMNLNVPTSDNTIVKLSKLGLKVGGTFTSPTVKIETKEMLQDAANTLKEQASKGVDQVKETAKQQAAELTKSTKEDLNKNLKQSGEEIKSAGKNVIDGLFKKK